MIYLKELLDSTKLPLMRVIGICLTLLIKCKKLLITGKNTKKRRLTSQEISNLQECDIVLVRNAGWISDKICEVTNSEWSHVALYIGNEEVIDADLLKKSGKRSIHSFDNYKIVRVKKLKKDDKEIILSFMNNQINKGYDYAQIAGFILEYKFGIKNSIHDTNRYTCAEIIDVAFKQTGVDLVSGIDGDVTPKDIEKSKRVKEVS